MGSESVVPSTIKWSQAADKRQNDYDIYSTIFNYYKRKPQSLNLLTFPAADWIFETNMSTLLKDHNLQVSFTGVERDIKVYRSMKRKLKRLNSMDKRFNYMVPSSAGSVADYIVKDYEKINKGFDIVYLDWMGTWSREKEEDIDIILEKNILKPRSLIFFTIMLSRGSKGTIERLKEYTEGDYISFPLHHLNRGKGDTFMYKTKGVVNLIANKAVMHKRKARLEHFSLYRGVHKRTTELSFGISLEKFKGKTLSK